MVRLLRENFLPRENGSSMWDLRKVTGCAKNAQGSALSTRFDGAKRVQTLLTYHFVKLLYFPSWLRRDHENRNYLVTRQVFSVFSSHIGGLFSWPPRGLNPFDSLLSTLQWTCSSKAEPRRLLSARSLGQPDTICCFRLVCLLQ